MQFISRYGPIRIAHIFSLLLFICCCVKENASNAVWPRVYRVQGQCLPRHLTHFCFNRKLSVLRQVCQASSIVVVCYFFKDFVINFICLPLYSFLTHFSFASKIICFKFYFLNNLFLLFKLSLCLMLLNILEVFLFMLTTSVLIVFVTYCFVL